MKRGIIIGGAAIAATATMFFKPLSSAPEFLVGEKPSTTPTPTKSEPPGAQVFTGDAIETRYGTVQVAITVENSKITDVQVLQAPTGQNMRYTEFAVPILKKQTLKAQSANISGASGASYTSGGFIQSLQSAISQM